MRLSAALILVALITVICLLLYAPTAAMFGRLRGRHTPVVRHLGLWALTTSVCVVVFATLVFALPAQSVGEPMTPNLVPFDWLFNPALDTSYGAIQYAMNIALFVPVGFLLPVGFASLRRWWAVAPLVTVAVLLIEAAQYFIGRVADIDDVIANVIGAILGAAVFSALNRRFRPVPWWRDFCALPPMPQQEGVNRRRGV